MIIKNNKLIIIIRIIIINIIDIIIINFKVVFTHAYLCVSYVSKYILY